MREAVEDLTDGTEGIVTMEKKIVMPHLHVKESLVPQKAEDG